MDPMSSLAMRRVASAPVSPSVTSGARFSFAFHSPSFPPVHELLELCEEELRTLMHQPPACTQLSPTHSYYADSESGLSNMNTPIDERYFVFPDTSTPSSSAYPSSSLAFSFDPVVTNTLSSATRPWDKKILGETERKLKASIMLFVVYWWVLGWKVIAALNKCFRFSFTMQWLDFLYDPAFLRQSCNDRWRVFKRTFLIELFNPLTPRPNLQFSLLPTMQF